jgi:hypothetical protein
MPQTTDGASLGEALKGFLGEHGHCWRVSGEDLTLIEDRGFLWLTCPGCEAAVLQSNAETT